MSSPVAAQDGPVAHQVLRLVVVRDGAGAVLTGAAGAAASGANGACRWPLLPSI